MCLFMEEENRCKKCKSTQTYIKRSTNERICRFCGYVENLNKSDDQNE